MLLLRFSRFCPALLSIPVKNIASLLLYAGVSIASVARRLGHSSMSTTQETYLHIIRELENQDNDKIMRHLAMLI